MELFENLPSTNTPILAVSLNQIQDNLVVVSPTEPTGNDREKVWIQKGKNLINYSRLFWGCKSGDNGEPVYVGETWLRTDFIRVQPNTEYIFSHQLGNTNGGINFYDKDRKSLKNISDANTTKFTTTNETYYVTITIWNENGITTSNETWLQLEQGSTATEYEPHIDSNKIYTKNANGNYEVFMEEDVVVSASEPTSNRAKVWIQKGKNFLDKNKLQNLFMASGSVDKNLPYDAASWTTEWIPCMPNTKYVLSGSNRNRCQIKDEDGTIAHIDSKVITTGPNTRFFRFYCWNNDGGDINTSKLQIEQGTVATPYEAYIKPKIHVKNDNGVYEEFISKEDIPSEVERHDITLNCGLVLHFFKYGKVVNCIAEGIISSLSADVDQTGNIPEEFAPVYAFRHTLLLDESGLIGYININTVGYFLIRSKTAISSNKYPRFSFTYIAN